MTLHGKDNKDGGQPITLTNLADKLILLSDIYRQASSKISDALVKEQAKRLALEKSIFLKDFYNVQNFKITEHMSEHGDRIGMERNNLAIQFNHLFMEEDMPGILDFFIDREEELIGEYHHIFVEDSSDDFTHMVLKNQMDETRQSMNELEDVKQMYNNKNTRS